MTTIWDVRRRWRRVIGAAAASVAIMMAVPSAQAVSLIGPGSSPAAKQASDAITTQVRGGHGGGGHGGGGFHGGGGGGFRGGGGFHGGGFHGGGFRGGGVAFRGGGFRAAGPVIGRSYHRYAPRPYLRHRYYAPRYYGYAPSYYYGPRRFCRVVFTSYGPRKICRYRPWHHNYRRHHWRAY